jgi:hypothetical protein
MSDAEDGAGLDMPGAEGAGEPGSDLDGASENNPDEFDFGSAGEGS